MNSIFWPKRKQHTLRVLQLDTPENFSAKLIGSLNQLVRQANLVRELERAGEKDSALVQTILVTIANDLARASGQLTDPASRDAMGLIAEGLMGSIWVKDTGAQLAALDEQELVSYVGPLSTWLGKSRETGFSAFFGTPNPGLQAVSDVVDHYHERSVANLARQLGAELRRLPACSYKIIDLIAIGGEADTFPKHFAYFMPEDQGIKYSPVKRTIVFANTYLSLFQQISREQQGIFGWTDDDLPADRDMARYLMSWFRGHDLGHSIVLPETDYRRLSGHDRWGSMVAQEAVADVFGFLLALSPDVADSLELEPDKMVRLYVLELFRYLRRGPAQFPDAGAAYAQLKMLEDAEVLTVIAPGRIRIDCAAFPAAMTRIARTLLNAVMSDNLETFERFLQTYGVHRARATDVLFGLSLCETSLFYEQSLLESE
ncbi:hypothetical protein BZK31_27340 [Pseudomonas floridensis]|uniref:Uncharacterized protein n=1 Tax=Pseudomonas floridensis TaxID=1958950 RepID=A0A1X0MXT1_9PSED|nr:hypothetical protein [Pseudomonas floridensis]ORC53560.1 hypothetical protein BZK31_27340 [Pseudomonas floridensis]